MTAEPIPQDHTYVDAEGWARDWLRAHPRLTSLIGGRVFFGVPDAVTSPYVIVSRVGGRPAGAIDSVRLSCEARGATKKSAADVAKGIAAAVDELGGTVDLFLWQPVAPDGAPRYIVDFSVDIVATVTGT